MSYVWQMRVSAEEFSQFYVVLMAELTAFSFNMTENIQEPFAMLSADSW